MWEQIASNRRKSITLVVFMAALLLCLGYAAGEILAPGGGGLIGVVIAFILWGVLSLVAYFQGDQIFLGISRAKKIRPEDHPQLWNVVKGDMSLVGPRPPIPKEVAEYTLADRRRLEAVPGITCTWQVSGRADIPFERQVELDVDYIETQSLRADLTLLLKTVPAVLFARGAY